jgi:hypothetical protein
MAFSTKQLQQQQRAVGSNQSRQQAFRSSRPAQLRRSGAAVVVRADGAVAAPVAAAPEAKKAGGVETSMTYLKPVLDIEAIKGVLPHR